MQAIESADYAPATSPEMASGIVLAFVCFSRKSLAVRDLFMEALPLVQPSGSKKAVSIYLCQYRRRELTTELEKDEGMSLYRNANQSS